MRYCPKAFRRNKRGKHCNMAQSRSGKNQQRTPPAKGHRLLPGHGPQQHQALRIRAQRCGLPAAVSRPAVPSAAPRPRTWPAASCWWGWVCFALRSCLCPGRIFGARCAAGTLAFSVSRPIWSDRSCCTWPTCFATGYRVALFAGKVSLMGVLCASVPVIFSKLNIENL